MRLKRGLITAEIKIYRFIDGFKAKLPVSMFNCVSNRICWIFEDEYKTTLRAERNTDFDYTIYKSGIEYSKQMYNKIKIIYEEYTERIKEFAILSKAVALDKDDVLVQKQALKDYFIEECDKVCFDDAVLCDILIDLCYRDGKNQAFAWDICGTQIIKNLGNSLYYPCLTDDAAGADFEFMGNYFIMTNGRNE